MEYDTDIDSYFDGRVYRHDWTATYGDEVIGGDSELSHEAAEEAAAKCVDDHEANKD